MSKEPVRAYLLGLLSDSEAAQVEERYFTDPDYFRLITAKEEALISDYLDERLPPLERDLFEKRYTAVPLLREKLETIRRQRRPHLFGFTWRALAVPAALAALLVAAWLFSRPRAEAPSVAEKQSAQPPPVLALFLSPGLQRGAATTPTIEVPANAVVKLTLELPGVKEPNDYIAAIVPAGSNGSAPPVWSMPAAVRSQPSATGQWVELRIAAAVLSPNDYLVELRSPTRELVERYLFRTIRQTN
jgi:anti-sigma factor RsiW